jgi:hypothetical protein
MLNKSKLETITNQEPIKKQKKALDGIIDKLSYNELYVIGSFCDNSTHINLFSTFNKKVIKSFKVSRFEYILHKAIIDC